jgi:hypothetical protein
MVNFVKLGDFMVKIQKFELIFAQSKATSPRQGTLANCGICVTQHINDII